MFMSRRVLLIAVVFVGLFGLVSIAAAKTPAPKPDKVRVAFGSWTGKGAGTFKSGVRSVVAKGTVITNKKGARALIEGEVVPKDKGVVFRLSIKAAQSGELIESREFPSPKPSPSRALLNKIGRAIVDMVQRVPVDQAAPQP
jgi:hypothetical protein